MRSPHTLFWPALLPLSTGKRAIFPKHLLFSSTLWWILIAYTLLLRLGCAPGELGKNHTDFSRIKISRTICIVYKFSRWLFTVTLFLFGRPGFVELQDKVKLSTWSFTYSCWLFPSIHSKTTPSVLLTSTSLYVMLSKIAFLLPFPLCKAFCKPSSLKPSRISQLSELWVFCF